MKREPPFKTEVELCAAFIGWAKNKGWISYAETAGWDILLVAADGTQIGVQAKLRFNMEVLRQCVEGRYSYWNTEGPDFRAVLVPQSGGGDICAALGMTQVAFQGCGNEFYPRLPTDRHVIQQDWHFLNPAKRYELPKYIPDVEAGAPAPLQLTRWKEGALAICAILEVRGFVTRKDFGNNGIDHRRWINDTGWLLAGSRPGEFVRGPQLVFDKQHPRVYAEIKAEVAEKLKSEVLCSA